MNTGQSEETDNLKIFITGGNGVLAGALANELDNYGHTVTLLDIQPNLEKDFHSVVADIRNTSDLFKVMKGHDAVVHTAALHGIHKGIYNDHDFLDVNVLGTYNVLHTAYQLGIKKFIFASSTSVYGASRSNIKGKTKYINEDTKQDPIDINDLTKVKGELLCRYFNKEYGMKCISLRIGRFYKGEDLFDHHLTKLHGGIDVLDVAIGIRLALEAKQLKNDVFCLSSKTPFTKEDMSDLINKADEVIEKYYPGTKKLFSLNNYEMPKTVHRIVDISRAETELGFNPKYNFNNFVDELRLNSTVEIS